ncbi:MAG: sulfur carrier protein ThiS [Deltaproteobacteria bacterium]|nr:sulfur carrier protein ThiS [Deltaproteobacteria bacterium]
MKEKTLKIVVNGLEEVVDEQTTVAHLVEMHGDGDVHLIVERNGRFVYPREYGSTGVEPGDEFELVHPDFGG